MSWTESVIEYTIALRAAGRSEQTIVQYRHYLDQVARTHRGAGPWAVTGRDLERIMANPGWGISARKSLRTAVTGFYRWAHGHGYTDVDPAATLPTVRVPRGVPRPAPDHVIDQVLVDADPRERLMIRLAAFAGLRAGEISRVHTEDLAGDLLLVHGKGDKERMVPIDDEELIDAINAVDGWLFPAPFNGSHITPNHVSKLMSRALPGHWTAHTLRHRFGTAAFAGTRDLLAVSELLGHASTVTTQTYVQLPLTHLRDAVRAARRTSPPSRYPQQDHSHQAA